MGHRSTVKRGSVKFLYYNVGDNQGDFKFGDDFSDTTSKAIIHKRKTDRLDFIKMKNSCSVNGILRE